MNTQHTTRNPGDLDLDFHDDGMAPLPSTRSGKFKYLSNGRILGASTHTWEPSIYMTRHLPWSGDLDVSYGEKGILEIKLPEGPQWSTNDAVQLLALPDDSALVYGTFGEMGAQHSFVFRLLPYGEGLDSTFGVNGFCVIDFGDQSDFITGLELLDDGKVMACVISQRTTAPAFHGSYLVRLDNGHVDTSFGENGRGYVEASDHPLRQLAVAPNGSYVLAGASEDLSKAVVRQYHADGSPDLAFGTDGQMPLPLAPGEAEIYQVKVQPDGKIVGVGAANVGFGWHTLTARLNPDGSMDSTFNNGEPKIMVFQGYETLNSSVDLMPDGRIVTGGYTTPTPNDVILMRMQANGAMDMSFGTNGQVVSDLRGDERCESVEIQPDGKILASGKRNRDVPYNSLFLARYLG